MGCMRQNLATFAQTALFLSPWNLASDPQPRKEQHCSDGVWGSTTSRAEVAEFLGKEEDRLLYLLYPQNFSSAPNGCVSQSLSVLADINLHLLLPLLILVFCTHPVPWVRRGNTMTKCQISSKLKILPLTRACMQRSKAALHLCALVSAATHAWNALEMCTAWPTIANHRSLFLPFPTNFPRSAGLADILSNVLWLAVRGGLDTASYLCYAENCRSDRALELCGGVVPCLHPLQLAASSASLEAPVLPSGASVLSVLEPSGCGWWKPQISLILSLRLPPPGTPVLPAKSMETQCLFPRLSLESRSVPVNGVWAAVTKLPTTVALTFRCGMKSLSW